MQEYSKVLSARAYILVGEVDWNPVDNRGAGYTLEQRRPGDIKALGYQPVRLLKAHPLTGT